MALLPALVRLAEPIKLPSLAQQMMPKSCELTPPPGDGNLPPPSSQNGDEDLVNSADQVELAMKQELHNDADNKYSAPVLPAIKARSSRIVKDSSRVSSANGLSPDAKLRSKPISVDSRTTGDDKKSVVFNKLRLSVNGGESNVSSLPRNQAVERYAPLRRRADTDCKGRAVVANLKMKELQSRVNESDRLLRDSQSELLTLKTQLEKLQLLNTELESQKKKLEEELFAAEAKIKFLEKHDQTNRKIDDKSQSIQKLQSFTLKPSTKAVEAQTNSLTKRPIPPVPPVPIPQAPVAGLPSPPPPPLPPQHVSGRANTVHKASALVELYQTITRRDGKQRSIGNGSCGNPLSSKVISIIGELQNRSSHLMAIKSDIETKGHLIKHLIEKVRAASFANMEDALSFVEWLDGELSTLSDERAVLKHFDWPEKKADALREAAFEFRVLKRLEAEVSSIKDDASLPCETTLKKISNLLDKLELSMDRLMKLRTSSMLLFRECKIPTDWMLDSGMVSKMKNSSVKLAKVYMRRVSMELESARNSERESMQEALVFEAVRFAYRAHQFAGGLDAETMFIFEGLKTRSSASMSHLVRILSS